MSMKNHNGNNSIVGVKRVRASATTTTSSSSSSSTLPPKQNVDPYILELFHILVRTGSVKQEETTLSDWFRDHSEGLEVEATCAMLYCLMNHSRELYTSSATKWLLRFQDALQLPTGKHSTMQTLESLAGDVALVVMNSQKDRPHTFLDSVMQCFCMYAFYLDERKESITYQMDDANACFTAFQEQYRLDQRRNDVIALAWRWSSFFAQDQQYYLRPFGWILADPVGRCYNAPFVQAVALLYNAFLGAHRLGRLCVQALDVVTQGLFFLAIINRVSQLPAMGKDTLASRTRVEKLQLLTQPIVRKFLESYHIDASTIAPTYPSQCYVLSRLRYRDRLIMVKDRLLAVKCEPVLTLPRGAAVQPATAAKTATTAVSSYIHYRCTSEMLYAHTPPRLVDQRPVLSWSRFSPGWFIVRLPDNVVRLLRIVSEPAGIAMLYHVAQLLDLPTLTIDATVSCGLLFHVPTPFEWDDAGLNRQPIDMFDVCPRLQSGATHDLAKWEDALQCLEMLVCGGASTRSEWLAYGTDQDMPMVVREPTTPACHITPVVDKDAIQNALAPLAPHVKQLLKWSWEMPRYRMLKARLALIDVK